MGLRLRSGGRKLPFDTYPMLALVIHEVSIGIAPSIGPPFPPFYAHQNATAFELDQSVANCIRHIGQ